MQVDNELNIEILETGTDKDYIYVLVLEKLEDKKIITQAHKLYNRSQKRYIVLVRNFLRNKVNCLVIRKELTLTLKGSIVYNIIYLNGYAYKFSKKQKILAYNKIKFNY